MAHKIFLASSKPDKFAFLTEGPGGGSFVKDPGTAEFIVVDLLEPPMDGWVPQTIELVAPLILTALDGKEDPASIAPISDLFALPPVCHDKDEVKRFLNWLRASLAAKTRQENAFLVRKMRDEEADR